MKTKFETMNDLKTHCVNNDLTIKRDGKFNDGSQCYRITDAEGNMVCTGNLGFLKAWGRLGLIK